MSQVEPFWQKAILEAIGPLVGAVVGTLLIGTFAAHITRRTQRRREEYQLREQLVIQMTEAASALYLETQQYWRAQQREHLTAERVNSLRAELDAQYHKTRVAGEVLESRLQVFFRSAAPPRLWHATIDLLTVRYFQVIGLATEKLLDANAGPEHSGLSAEELKNPQAVLDAYRARLRDATRAVLVEPLTAVEGVAAEQNPSS